MPGAGFKCIDPNAMMDNGVKPHDSYDSKKYPFLAMEFPFDKPEFVVTDHASQNVYATPHECEPCKALKQEIEDLKETVEDLESR